MVKYIFRDAELLTIKDAKKADPQKIGEALEEVSNKSGGHLFPGAVVDAARNRSSPLHRYFEWDDVKAANKYRLDQARSIIRSIHVESSDTESGTVRAFVSIREKDGVSYRNISDVLKSADLQQRLLAQAEKDLLAFEARFVSLTDVCELVREARQRLNARRQAGQDSRASA